MNYSKNEIIKQSYQRTLERRKLQVCKTYILKVDISSLSDYVKFQLGKLFLEAKWLYNYILSTGDVDDKVKTVTVKLADGTFEERPLTVLGSQIKQAIIKRTLDSIRGLSTLKDNGYKVGCLKFKSEVDSIPLIQYGMTWEVRKDSRVRIEKINSNLKVNGLKQIPKEAELTSAVLVRRGVDYYLHVTCYLTKVGREFETEEALGIDFGVKNQLTLSNGIRINYKLPTDKVEQLKRTHKELSHKKYKSNNYFKTKLKLNRQYEHLNNVKKDMRNKIVSRTTYTYRVICIQNDVIRGWQRLFGKRILETSIGEMRRVLQTHTHTLIEVDTFFPSSQLCSYCGSRQSVTLNDRVYICNVCQKQMDRDLNAAINIREQGLSLVPTERRDVKPVETITNTLIEYLKSVRGISASYVGEAGSQLTLS